MSDSSTGKADEGCTICDKVGLKPFTKENIFYYYIPLYGAASYGTLAVSVMNPKLVPNLLLRKPDMLNVLLLSSIVGSAFFLYGRPHLRRIPNGRRGVYAIFGGSLFTMGSVLNWSIAKTLLPQNNAILATLVGVVSAVVFVKLSTDYIGESDKLVASQ